MSLRRDEDEIEHILFFIQDLCEQGEIYEEVIKYISAVLNLYCNVCSSRNERAKKQIINLGLNFENIRNTMTMMKKYEKNLRGDIRSTSGRVHWYLQIGYMRLLQTLFIDIEPFTSVCS